MAARVYPCPPPPDHPNNPQAIGSARRTSTSNGMRICCLVLGIFLFAVLFLFSWLFYYASMKYPHIPQFKLESATVSQLNTNSSSLTPTWDISLLARNPNNPSNPLRRYKIYFDWVHAEVQYQYIGDQVIKLANTQLPPFHVKEREDQRLDFKVEAVGDKQTGDFMARQIYNDVAQGSVRFDVTLTIVVRFKAKLVPSERDVFEVSCRELDFGFSGNNGTGVLTSQSSCSVKKPACYGLCCIIPRCRHTFDNHHSC